MPDTSKIELGEDPQQEPQVPLEQKYREQMRQIVSQKIELPISTLPGMIEKQINLSPDFQRRERWSRERQSRFIESIIMNVPIPPVFLGEDDYGNYVVLDGRQRLTAVHQFLQNGYALKKLEVWKELNGQRFLDLEKKKLDRTITRRFIPAVIILKESSPEVKYDVFDRLNTGGVVANYMEIRNAIYQGKFNTLMHKLSDDTGFRELWGISTNDEQREKDEDYRTMVDVELVLRFFALREPDKMDLAFRDYLGEFMGERNKAYTSNSTLEQQDEAQFRRAVRNCLRVFGPTAFEKRPGTRSAPLADAYMTALSLLNPDAVTTEISSALKSGLTELLQSQDFQKAITSGTNGKGAIRTRIQMAIGVVRKIAPQALFV